MAAPLMTLLGILLSLISLATGGRVEALAPQSQALGARVTGADGVSLVHYPVREGVRGNGDTFQIELDGGHRTVVHGHWPADDLVDGPAWLACEVRDGRVVALDLSVGTEYRGRDRIDRDLGEVDAAAVAAWLLDLVPRLETDVAEDAVNAAFVARDADCSGRLLDLAVDRTLDADLRRHALLWAAHEAGARLVARAGSILDDQDEEFEVREAAVVALSRSDDPRAVDRLFAVARGDVHPELRHIALIMLARREDDPRVVALLEEIILGE